MRYLSTTGSDSGRAIDMCHEETAGMEQPVAHPQSARWLDLIRILMETPTPRRIALSKITTIAACALLCCSSSSDAAPATHESARVLVIRGGHAYDTPAFENMCRQLPAIQCDLVLTAHFERMSAQDIDTKYDVLLFLNQNKKYRTEDRNRKRYMDLAQLGVGMVFLHFTLSSEPDWDEYHDLIGGKWFLKSHEENQSLHSTYFTDMTTTIRVLDSEHPTTEGLRDFEITDAFYGNIYIAPGTHRLLGCDDANVAKAVAWTHMYGNSRVVYLMPGFTESAYNNPSYRRFLANSLRYCADHKKRTEPPAD